MRSVILAGGHRGPCRFRINRLLGFLSSGSGLLTTGTYVLGVTQLTDTPQITLPDGDSLERLDYRTRTTALRAQLAPAGRYLAVSGDDEEWLIPLDAKTTHVGRGLLADIRFDDHRISRLHAIITDIGGKMRMLDGRSTGGTFVNGRRVIAADLKDGDTIRFGPLTLRYVERLLVPCRMTTAPSPLRKSQARDPSGRVPAPRRRSSHAGAGSLSRRPVSARW
jgi:hypothetical protein